MSQDPTGLADNGASLQCRHCPSTTNAKRALPTRAQAKSTLSSSGNRGASGGYICQAKPAEEASWRWLRSQEHVAVPESDNGENDERFDYKLGNDIA